REAVEGVDRGPPPRGEGKRGQIVGAPVAGVQCPAVGVVRAQAGVGDAGGPEFPPPRRLPDRVTVVRGPAATPPLMRAAARFPAPGCAVGTAPSGRGCAPWRTGCRTHAPAATSPAGSPAARPPPTRRTRSDRGPAASPPAGPGSGGRRTPSRSGRSAGSGRAP